ncbi:MAG: hypothetical protein GF308_08695 [Candidatus Heimdallarchaeota archaeon]|nr:hypothetical protein [Candidatus Heimdallarchaeota archaeon]
MKKAKTKAMVVTAIVFTIFVVGTFAARPQPVQTVEPFFTIVAKTSPYGATWPDYMNFLKQHLGRIGINVDIQLLDWPTYIMELIVFRDYDVYLVGLGGGGVDPGSTAYGVYSENASLNAYNYHTSMDYNETLGTGVNQWYIEEGLTMMPPDSEERIEHYHNWQQYMMDDLLPCKPTFSPLAYTAHWANLKGYNASKGVVQSWGKMYFDGSHDGQGSTNELVISHGQWSDLNPLFQDDAASSFISGSTLDTLIRYDVNKKPWPHLATGWEMLNETHLRVTLREGIKWQTDPDGLFTNEYFDAKDVYFTFYAWREVSNDQHLYSWLEKMEIIDDYTIDIYIDGDPTTPENEPYSNFLTNLWTNMMPEHYLNQTQEADGVTPDVNHDSWNTYATHSFGTGILEFGTYTDSVETIMEVYDDCWLMDASVDKSGMDFENNFGNVWDLDRLRVRIIPDQQTALLEFEAGKTDIEGVGTFPEKRDNYIADPDKNVQTFNQDFFEFFGFNMGEERPYVGNPDPCPNDPTISIGLAIRKAMAYAIDRIEINNVLYRGEWAVTDHPIYPTMGIWCNPNIIRYNHDIEKAREYMAKAGFEITEATGSQIITTAGPGFEFLIAIASILSVTTIVIVRAKKRKT